MTTDPLFSIVTITKDDPAGLSVTQAGIAAQSFRDFEWIVVNGGAPCSPLPAHIIHESDDGLYDAMNKGLAKARGQYVWFLNGGDAPADADILATLARHVAAFPASLVYGDSMERLGDGFQVKRARAPHTIGRGLFTHHQAILYRREDIGALRYDAKLKIAGDYKFTRAFLTSTPETSYIPAPLCVFAAGGLSQKNAFQGRCEEFKVKYADKPSAAAFYITVFALQSCTMMLRRLSPALYWRIRAMRA